MSKSKIQGKKKKIYSGVKTSFFETRRVMTAG